MEHVKNTAENIAIFVLTFMITSGISCSKKVVTCGAERAEVQAVAR